MDSIFVDHFWWLLTGFFFLAVAWEYFVRRRPELRGWLYEVAAWLINLTVLMQIIAVAILALL